MKRGDLCRVPRRGSQPGRRAAATAALKGAPDFDQGGGLAAAVAASPAKRRSSQMIASPQLITTVAPVITKMLGSTDQNTQSSAKAHRIDEYSNGATTEGGALRKASVTQNCPSAPLMPMSAIQPQSPVSTARQAGAATIA